jgi:hypothetical protein
MCLACIFKLIRTQCLIMRKSHFKMDHISFRHSILSHLRTCSFLLSLFFSNQNFSVRAAINLEAAGTTGREILFQATSEEMIEAYSHVPRYFLLILPHANANTPTDLLAPSSPTTYSAPASSYPSTSLFSFQNQLIHYFTLQHRLSAIPTIPQRHRTRREFLSRRTSHTLHDVPPLTLPKSQRADGYRRK